MPTLIQSWGVMTWLTVGLLAAIILHARGVVGMILIGRHSTATRERRSHFAACTGFQLRFCSVPRRPAAGNLPGLAARSCR